MSPLTSRYIRLLLMCGIPILLANCAHNDSQSTGRHRRHSGPAAPTAVATAKAIQTSVRPNLKLAGIISPYQNVVISSQLAEPALEVDVVQGDHVRAGQTLARFDVADLRGQLNGAIGNLANAQAAAKSAQSQLRAARLTADLTVATGSGNVNSAQAAVNQAQITLQNDSRNYQRNLQLSAQGYIPQQTLDQSRTLMLNDQASLRTAQANLATAQVNATVNQGQGLPATSIATAENNAQAAQAAIQTAQGQVTNLQAQIAKAVIVSPTDGVIVNRNLNTGEYPGGRTLFTIQEMDRVYLNLNASSSDVFTIAKGSSVSVHISGSPHTYTGHVNAVLGQVAPGSTNFTVQAIIANTDGHLQSGLPATAEIALPPVRGIGIPSTSFLDDTHTAILSVVKNSSGTIAHKLNVVERSSDGTMSIVAGIAAGTSLVKNGQLGITDGQQIDTSGPHPRTLASPGDADSAGQAQPNPGSSPGHRHHRHTESPDN